MNYMNRKSFLIAVAAALVSLPIGSALADSQAVTLGDLEISGAFARATLPSAPSAAAYITVTNKGAAPDTLVSVSSPVAGSIFIHGMKMEGNVMKMTELKEGLPIPAGATVTMAPSAFHMMFEHLAQPFVEGKSVPVTLNFAKAGTVNIDVPVLGIAATGPAKANSMKPDAMKSGSMQKMPM
jgi:copper(I)-binding protein